MSAKTTGSKGFELEEEIYSRFGSNCSDSERQGESLTKRGKETVDEQAPRASNTMSSEQPCIKRVHRRVLKFTPDENRCLKQGIKKGTELGSGLLF